MILRRHYISGELRQLSAILSKKSIPILHIYMLIIQELATFQHLIQTLPYSYQEV